MGTNVNISSVPGNNGIDCPVVLMTAVLVVALVDVFPNPKNTTTLPLLIIRYWLPPSVLERACTGVGDEVAAVKTTVLPSGVNAFVLM